MAEQKPPKTPSQLFISHLADLGKPEAPVCPLCKTKKWSIGQDVLVPPVLGPNRTVQVGTTVPVITLICQHCHYIMMFAMEPIEKKHGGPDGG